MSKTIQPMNTLDKFGYRELAELNALIQAYANAGTYDNGKIYAYLPESWHDDGVYPDFNANSGLVFLTNSEYQVLVNTEYGLMMYYNTPYGGHEGTLFDLADEVNDDLSDNEGNTTPAGAGRWHIDDLNEVYGYINKSLKDFDDEDNIAYLCKVKDRIVKAFILAELTNDPLTQDELDQYSDAELIDRCLFDFDYKIKDASDFRRYVVFVRSTAKAMLEA